MNPGPSGSPDRQPERLTALDALYLAVTVSCSAVAVAACRAAPCPAPAAQAPWAVVAGFVCAVAFSAAGEVYVRRPRAYLALLALHLVLSLIAVALSGGTLAVALCLGLPITLGICLYNPWRVGVLMSLAANGLILAAWLLSSAKTAGVGSVVADGPLEYGLLTAAVTCFASLAVSYRERLVTAQRENRRLDALVERLTRANLNTQEYARTIEESSTDTERKRITRDIHDVVGYTLTNNITMMEAITDIMRTNPLGVAALVDAARENAEEGLARVREALHLLRGAEVTYPTGIRAVNRLVQVFQHATGVRVEFAYSDIAWDFPPDVDSALYHVVQEGLMNCFRHGRATLVRVFLRRDGGENVLSLRDNGIGAGDMKEGIGLTGMRERLQRLGGRLSAGSVPGGFELEAAVPASSQRESP